MVRDFSIQECFWVGWARFKEHPWFFLSLSLLLWIMASLSSYITDTVYAHIEPTRSLFDVLFTFISYWFMFGCLAVTLRAVDGLPVDWSHVWMFDRRFLSYLVGLIIYGVLMTLGLLLFIFPGIYFALRYGFFWYGIIDGRLGVRAAFEESARITDSVKWRLILFVLASTGVMLLGVLCLGVGALVALPVAMLASAHLYRVLLSQSGAARPNLVPASLPQVKDQSDLPAGLTPEAK